MQGEAGLGELTQPLFDRILKNFEAEDGMKGVAICRLVSKAWLAAVRQYPGTARSCSEANSLRRLSSIMPGMSRLCISFGNTAHLDSSLVEQLKQLTSLKLSASSPAHLMASSESISMTSLPSVLRELTVRNIGIAPDSFRYTPAALTFLEYQAPWEKQEWLPHLQELRVSIHCGLNGRGLRRASDRKS